MEVFSAKSTPQIWRVGALLLHRLVDATEAEAMIC